MDDKIAAHTSANDYLGPAKCSLAAYDPSEMAEKSVLQFGPIQSVQFLRAGVREGQ